MTPLANLSCHIQVMPDRRGSQTKRGSGRCLIRTSQNKPARASADPRPQQECSPIALHLSVPRIAAANAFIFAVSHSMDSLAFPIDRERHWSNLQDADFRTRKSAELTD
jgi:hypothetical protein